MTEAGGSPPNRPRQSRSGSGASPDLGKAVEGNRYVTVGRDGEMSDRVGDQPRAVRSGHYRGEVPGARRRTVRTLEAHAVSLVAAEVDSGRVDRVDEEVAVDGDGHMHGAVREHRDVRRHLASGGIDRRGS